jgi:hypothetical protein
MLVKTTSNFKDSLTTKIGTSYDFLSDASEAIGTMMGGSPVALTTADITNEILNDSSLSQQIYVLLTAKSALVIFDQIDDLLKGRDPTCPLDDSRIDPFMKQRINLSLEVTLEGQHDQSIPNKVKYLMLLLSDVMSKCHVSAERVVNDLSSKKELASVCKCIKEQLESTGDNKYDTLSGKGEASEMFFTIVQPQQKSTVSKKGKSMPEQGDPTISIEPPTENLYAKERPPKVESRRRSQRIRAKSDPDTYDMSKHSLIDEHLPKNLRGPTRKKRHRDAVASNETRQK